MERWELYWADFPHQDEIAESNRPMLVIVSKDEYVLGFKVTKHEARDYDEFDCTLMDWQQAGLTYPSVVRVSKLGKITPDKVYERI